MKPHRDGGLTAGKDAATAAAQNRPASDAAGRPLTTFEAARRLGVAFSTVNYWIDAGRLRGYRTPGGHRRIRPEDLETFIRDHHFGPSTSRTILVVDDEDAFRRALVRRIKTSGIEAELLEAADGFDAGRLIVAKRPDLVILDIRLPGVDGFEVLRRMAGMTPRPRVIAVSGHEPDAYRRKALALGAVAFFAKPFETVPFLDLVRSSLAAPPLASGDGLSPPRRRSGASPLLIQTPRRATRSLSAGEKR